MRKSVSRIVVVALFLSLCLSGIVATLAPFVSAATPPDAPVNLNAASGNRTVTLTWASYSSTFNGGSAIDSIAIYYGTSPGARTNVTTVSGTATSCLFNNLILGQKYYFALRSHNAVGWSPESKEINATFAAFPYAARNLAVSYSGNATSMATATISWEAPTNTGGTPLTHYVVSVSHKIAYPYYPGYTWTYDVQTTVGPDVTSYVVDSLVRGGSYSVRVEAYNAVGYSSTSLLTVPPATTPGAPTNLRAVPGYGQVSIHWDAPSGGGTTILGYHVKYGDSPSNMSTNVSAGTNLYKTFSGLTVGVEYHFSVQAYNSLGWSPESPVISATPVARTVPSAPTSVQVTGALSGLIYISWYAPSSNGGYLIDEYAVRYSTEPGGPGNTVSVGMPTSYDGEYRYALSGLTPGQTYYISVLAHNSLGWSVGSPESSIICARTPDDPQNLAITYSGDDPSNANATLTWEAPLSDGGRPISNYTVDVGTWYSNQYGYYYTSLFHGVFGPDVTSCQMDLPRGYVNYTCSVEATNEAGYSNATYILITTPCSAPAPPAYIHVYPGYNQATLRISLPTVSGGTSVNSYMVLYGTAPGDRTYNVTIAANPSTYTDYVFTNLTEDDVIYCVVLAHNNVGWSAASSEIIVTSLRTTPVVPTPPTSVVAARGDGTVTVRWYPPTDDGGRSVDTYSILYGTSPGAASVNLSVGLPYAYEGSPYFTYQVTGLTNGQTYYFTVLAHNEIGWSSGSAEVSCTPAAKPTVPQNLTIAYSGSNVPYGSATIDWERPSSDGGSAITGYFLDIGYYYQPGYNQPYRWYSLYHTALGPDETSASVTDRLSRGYNYTLVVYANNSVGSTYVSTYIIAPAVAPAAPTSLTATPSYENITLSWPRPSTGGAAIDYYNILYGTAPDDLIYLVNVTATSDPMSHRINGLDVGTTYYFVVKAHNSMGWSPESPVASSVFSTSPSAPLNLNVAYIESDSELTSALVSWEEPSFDGGAPLVRYRATVGFWHSSGYHYEYYGVLDLTTLSFTVHNLSRGCAYEVRIVAEGLVSSSVAEMIYTPPVLAPGAPHDLQVVYQGEDNIVLRWGYAAENGASIDQYKVCYGSSTGLWTVEVAGGQPYTDVPITGLDSGWAYYFVVMAHNSAGWSQPSNEVCAAPVSSADNVPPSLISISPTDGSAGVSTSVSIVLRFSEAMDKTSVEGAFLLLSDDRAVPGTFAWSEGDTVCTFIPISLSVSTTYIVQVGSGAADVPGNPLDPFTFQFTTEPDTTPPVTTLGLDGMLDPNGHYINGVTISFDAVDAHFSVNHTEYSLDGTTWLRYDGPFLSAAKGQYYIYYRSLDVCGNLESYQSALVSVAGITITAPTAGTEWTVSMDCGAGANVQYLTSGTVGASFLFDLYKGGMFVRTMGAADQSIKDYYSDWTQGLVSGDDYQIKVRSTTDPAYWTMSEEFTIIVLPPPQTPAALFDVPSVTNSTTVSFDASASHSMDSPPGTIQVRWDWDNDGVWDTEYSSELIAYHAFSGGSHTVALQVLDSNGLTNTTRRSVYVDVTLPSVSLEPSGTMGTNGWFTSSISVTLVTDDDYGIDSVTYRIDDGSWLPYTGAIIIAMEGTHTVHGMVTDVAGNQRIVLLNIKIDTIAPTIEGAPTTSPNGYGWYNNDVTIHFTASDGGSGLATVTPDQLMTAEGYGLGVTGTAVDQAGNSATFTVTGINIDRTAPTGSASANTSPNGNGWYNADVEMVFSLNDSLSGISGSSSPIAIIETEGSSVTTSVIATDLAGNTATIVSPAVKLDKTAPTGSASPDRPANSNGWYNADVTIAFVVDDGLSGIDLSRSGELITVISTEGAAQTGSTTFYDLAGNSVTLYPPTINIDKTAPTGSAAPTSSPNANGWYRADVTMLFSLADALSGIDGAAETQAVIDEEGASITISVVATDLAGNTAVIASPAVNIDKTDPIIDGAPLSAPNVNGWYNDSVTIRFEAMDELSGLLVSDWDIMMLDEGAGQEATQTVSDLAGNIASFTVSDINIDKTAPTLIGEPTTAANAQGWYGGDVIVHFTAADGLSGVVTAPEDVVVTGEGNDLVARATVLDMAGNFASLNVSVKIDRIAPMTSLYIDGASYDGTGAITINSTASLTFDAADLLSGVNEIRYRIDGGEWVVYSGSLALTEGEHTLTYRSVDQAGNLESERQTTINIIATTIEGRPSSIGTELIVVMVVVAAAGAAGVFLLRRRKP